MIKAWEDPERGPGLERKTGQAQRRPSPAHSCIAAPQSPGPPRDQFRESVRKKPGLY